MLKPDDTERREFIRIKTRLRVAYKFFKTSGRTDLPDIFEGFTDNVSGDGLLLSGKIPNLEIPPDLLLGRVIIGVNVFIDDGPEPVKALARVRWIEAFDPQDRESRIGLQFKEITKDNRDRILRYIIRQQMP